MRYWMVCCTILLCFQLHAQQVDYYTHIAPVIYANCTYCHKTGGSAPFALQSYNDVKSRGSQIAYAVNHKIMPPWKADPNFRSFANQRILSDSDIALIGNWVKGGMPEGDSKKQAKLQIPDKGIGAPDMQLAMPIKYKVNGNNTDTVVRFYIPYTLPADTFAYAIEVVPGNAKVVHHANPMIYDKTAPRYARSKEDILISDVIAKDKTYRDTFTVSSMVFYADFVPGAGPQMFPDGFGVAIPKSGFVLLEVHYSATTVEQFDQTTVNFYFTKTKPERIVVPKRFGSAGGIVEPVPPLIIPADSIKTFTLDAFIPYNLTFVAVGAHMHYLGKSMVAIAITPSGDTIPLIKVDNYDFRWQESYRPEYLIHVPQGSRVVVSASYDNTSNNPNNPYSPPRFIKQGWRANDEMMSFPVYMTEYKEGDENIKMTR